MKSSAHLIASFLGEVETVAGLLIAELGALPVEGATVSILLPVDAADLVADDPRPVSLAQMAGRPKHDDGPTG